MLASRLLWRYTERRRWSFIARGFTEAANINGSAVPNSYSGIESVKRKRVFGIAAHIDAGKTTTSEAILHASGSLRRARMGRVDRGDTALDFLPAERERGITIQSAAATFDWGDHRIFLVDSPGHLDFTFEVERALRVMDAVVVVIDAVAGVQPQTETVWRQADRAELPRLLLVNKMDRDGARLDEVVEEIQAHFGVRAPLVQYPLHGDDGTFLGVFDLITLEVRSGELLPPEICLKSLMVRAQSSRDALVEAVADVDDNVMSLFLEEKPITPEILSESIRKACAQRKLVPVLCAAALKDLGVRELMDGVVGFLPSPSEKEEPLRAQTADGRQLEIENNHEGMFVAQAFKVTHDGHRGRLVHFRAFSGTLDNKKLAIWNCNKQKKERPSKWLHMLADTFTEQERIECGDVFAMVGLRYTETGDTISLDSSKSPILDGMQVPQALCSVSIETDSPSAQRDLDEFLAKRLAEDPSLRLVHDENTGESLLSGVGELHLESICDRARSELKLDLHVSQPRVAYRESVRGESDHVEDYDAQIGMARLTARLRVRVEQLKEPGAANIVQVKGEHWSRAQKEALADGLEAGLARGRILGYRTQGISAVVSAPPGEEEHCSQYAEAALRACCSKAAREAMAAAEPIIVEPMMKVVIDVPEEYQRELMNMLAHPTERRGRVQSSAPLDWRNDATTYVRINATVPLQGMIGWTSKMRSITKGRGTFSMELDGYEQVPTVIRDSLVKGIH